MVDVKNDICWLCKWDVQLKLEYIISLFFFNLEKRLFMLFDDVDCCILICDEYFMRMAYDLTFMSIVQI